MPDCMPPACARQPPQPSHHTITAPGRRITLACRLGRRPLSRRPGCRRPAGPLGTQSAQPCLPSSESSQTRRCPVGRAIRDLAPPAWMPHPRAPSKSASRCRVHMTLVTPLTAAPAARVVQHVSSCCGTRAATALIQILILLTCRLLPRPLQRRTLQHRRWTLRSVQTPRLPLAPTPPAGELLCILAESPFET